MRKPKVSKPAPVETWPKVIETFQTPDGWALSQLTQAAPSCFNGMVRVERYRITVERIPEPIEVIGARLQALWEQSDNHHDWEPLKAKAKALGVTLQGGRGDKRPAKPI